MTRRIDQRRARVEAELQGDVAPELELSAARAWRRMADRISPVIAVELGLGKEAVENYGNPRKRKYGPHLRLLQALQIALDLKPRAEQRADVFAPLDWIEQQLGRRVLDVERAAASDAPASRAERIAIAITEVAEFIAAAAGEPGAWNAEQRLRVHQELQGALAALSVLADELDSKSAAAANVTRIAR